MIANIHYHLNDVEFRHEGFQFQDLGRLFTTKIRKFVIWSSVMDSVGEDHYNATSP